MVFTLLVLLLLLRRLALLALLMLLLLLSVEGLHIEAGIGPPIEVHVLHIHHGGIYRDHPGAVAAFSSAATLHSAREI